MYQHLLKHPLVGGPQGSCLGSSDIHRDYPCSMSANCSFFGQHPAFLGGTDRQCQCPLYGSSRTAALIGG